MTRARATSRNVLVKKSPPATTRAYDTYWRFAAERQRVFHRRARGEGPPWTDDEVIQDYRFTNAYRASDRVSQYLIGTVLPNSGPRPEDIFFRVLLFKIFNSISTWELLESAVGSIKWESYSYQRYDRALSAAFSQGTSIYSGAYIMPSVRRFGHERKHSNHLKLVEHMIGQGLATQIAEAPSLGSVYRLLLDSPGIGKFLAFQYTIDLNYGALTSFSENDFVVAGPGAKSGIRKCFSDSGGYSDEDLIRLMADRQQDEFERLGLVFEDLWGRPLMLIDCQNLFCETDKYCRKVHPELVGKSNRTRIKQKFVPAPTPINYRFPKAWNVIPASPERAGQHALP